ncbi:MAG TPA: DoxX family protein [Bryobacteraceae bacterium]|nr:DoxX family protein [Bryobacteraceae bacterium]
MAARTANQGAISKKALWTGRIISWLAILFLLMDGVMKVFKPVFVVEATVRLGYPESAIFGTGALLIAFTLLYALPRTRVLGAVLLTGYLGGAVAIQVRALSSQFESVFPVLFGALLWAGVWLRDTRVRSLTNA